MFNVRLIVARSSSEGVSRSGYTWLNRISTWMYLDGIGSFLYFFLDVLRRIEVYGQRCVVWLIRLIGNFIEYLRRTLSK